MKASKQDTMNELREQIEKVVHDAQDDYAVDKKHMPSQGIRAREIIALIPKPTVWLTCDKCGGEGFKAKGACETCNLRERALCQKECPCTCTNGKIEHLIEWTYAGSILKPFVKTLTLPDLRNADVAGAYYLLTMQKGCHDVPIRLNKGTLRIGAVKKERA